MTHTTYQWRRQTSTNVAAWFWSYFSLKISFQFYFIVWRWQFWMCWSMTEPPILTVCQRTRVQETVRRNTQPSFQANCKGYLRSVAHYNKKAQLSLTNPRDAKACQNCFNLACLQRCRWQYWPIFMRLTAIASEIHEMQRNWLKIPTYGVQGHPRSPILVPIESPYVTCY